MDGSVVDGFNFCRGVLRNGIGDDFFDILPVNGIRHTGRTIRYGILSRCNAVQYLVSGTVFRFLGLPQA